MKPYPQPLKRSPNRIARGLVGYLVSIGMDFRKSYSLALAYEGKPILMKYLPYFYSQSSQTTAHASRPQLQRSVS